MCGASDASYEFCAGRCVHVGEAFVDQPHLRRDCRRCRYVWLTRVVDGARYSATLTAGQFVNILHNLNYSCLRADGVINEAAAARVFRIFGIDVASADELAVLSGPPLGPPLGCRIEHA